MDTLTAEARAILEDARKLNSRLIRFEEACPGFESIDALARRISGTVGQYPETDLVDYCRALAAGVSTREHASAP